MKTTAIVLGSTGMVGQTVLQTLAADPSLDVWGTYRSPSLFEALDAGRGVEFDARSGREGLSRLVDSTGGCHCFINTIAALKSEIDEASAQSVSHATFLNGEFPHELADYAQSIGAWVIHISTDGVYGVNSEIPYLEDVPPDADDIYGRTKRLGEPETDTAITIRTSFIGPDALRGKGLYEWFRRQPAGAHLHGFTDVQWRGVTTLQFARCCLALLTSERAGSAGAAALERLRMLRAVSRIHHFVPNDPCSKFELLEVLRRVLVSDVSITPVHSPGGPYSRILGSRFRLLSEWCGAGGSLESAVRELVRNTRTPPAR